MGALVEDILFRIFPIYSIHLRVKSDVSFGICEQQQWMGKVFTGVREIGSFTECILDFLEK